MLNEDLSKLKIEKSPAVVASRKRRKLFYPVIAAVIFLTGLFYLKGKTVEVEVANVSQIYPSQTFTVLNSSGYVVAQRKAAVASKITGRLVSINVEEGNHVKKGDLIARLENEDTAALREQAEANLNITLANLEKAKAELHEAAVNFNRYKELLKSELVSRSDYDSSEARYKKAVASVAETEAAVKAGQAALNNAEVSLEYSFIRVPFDAVVLTKNADIGDIVTPLGAAANAKAAVVTDPTIIVADEPTGDLDRVSAEEILELMERLVHELGKTIIMVTHDPRAAKKAHLIKYLDKGVLNAENVDFV